VVECEVHVFIFYHIDALFPASGAKTTENTLRRKFSSELERLDGHVFVVAIADGSLEDLDPDLALIGRFTEFQLPLPDSNGREEILEIHCK
jgi:SpoVK/Ycf46/Vps4 family AAA+-type ATPase